MEKEIENLIEQLTKVRPEMLNEEALKLFNTIMAVLDERDKLIKRNKELEREKEMHKNNSNKLYKDYNKLTDEFDLLNQENNRKKETIKRYRKYLDNKDKRFKEALENEYQERETDYIPKSKIKEKIEELNMSGGSNGQDNIENLARELAIEILQELMEDK